MNDKITVSASKEGKTVTAGFSEKPELMLEGEYLEGLEDCVVEAMTAVARYAAQDNPERTDVALKALWIRATDRAEEIFFEQE